MSKRPYQTEPIAIVENPKASNSKGKSSNGELSESEQARLRILWEETMKHSSKFVQYDKVAVLMLSWDERNDDLRTKAEVDKLREVFERDYNFEVRQVFFNHGKRAQPQMVKALSTFVLDFEGAPSTLLIVYYAGHGWGDMPKDGHQSRADNSKQRKPLDLRLAGTTSQAAQPQIERNTIMWKQARTAIEECEADVLLVFDCCHAGLLCRSRAPKRFETLAACSADAKTGLPGKSSFTSAVIWALKKLKERKKFFTTSELLTEIVSHEEFPTDQHPVLSESVPSISHIVLAPLGDGTNSSTSSIPEEDREDPRSTAKSDYIDLRFHFHDLSDEAIKEVAQLLRKIMHENQILGRRIDLLGKNTVWQSQQWQVAAVYANYWQYTAHTAKRRKVSPTEASTKSHTSLSLPATPQSVSPDPFTPAGSGPPLTS